MSRYDDLNENDEIFYEDASCFEQYPNEKIRMKLHTGEKREQLKESIIKSGIITPIIAMPSCNRGKLTIISGQNRWDIAKELMIPVPYQLKTNLTQEQADLICIDTNLLNRQFDEYLPSELSAILKVKYDILKSQGKRNDLTTETSRSDCAKLEAEYKLSQRSIQNYIRLSYLNDGLLQMVDDKILSISIGITLSFLRIKEQDDLLAIISEQKFKITPAIADELKKLSQDDNDEIDVKRIIDGLNKPEDKNKSIKISSNTIKKITNIIPKEDQNRIDEIILIALTEYYKK